MPAPKLLTYGDAVEHLIDYAGGTSDAASQRVIRKCIPAALDKLCQEHNWRYFDSHYRITTVESYSTGTIAYDHASRVVTLTGGTWPDWTLYGTLQIGERIHRIESVTDSTHVVLSEVHNPGDDVDAGSTFALFQSIYTLPGDFRQMHAPMDNGLRRGPRYVTPAEWLRLAVGNGSSGNALAYTVMGDPYRIGSMALHLWGYPTAINAHDFIYQRTPRELRFSGFSNGEYGGTRPGASSSGTGTATALAGSASVTINSGALLDEMRGCVLRLGRTAAAPEGIGGLNPWREQKILWQIDSATAAEVDSVLTNAYTAVGYTISDPIDLPPQLIDAFLRACEKQYCLARPQARERLEDANAEYEKALVQAKENDAGPMQPQSAWDRRRGVHLDDIAIHGPEVDFPN